MPDKIIIKGAKVHNLKNVNLEIPKNKLVVITGLSGSGKSSLAFDTVYAEGQRRYAESLSAYARQFMDAKNKPDVDAIDGLSPTIAIDQKVHTQNPRSTVGTVSEIYDYLRLLFARVGKRHCPDCGEQLAFYTAGEITEKIKASFKEGQKLYILSPLVLDEKVHKEDLLVKAEKSGYGDIRLNKKIMKINDFADFVFDPEKKYSVELVIGKVDDIKKENIAKMVDVALELSNGLIGVSIGREETIYSTVGLCLSCKKIYLPLDVHNFSFNSPHGACPRCTGLGKTMEVVPDLVVPNKRLTLAEGAVQPWTRIAGRQVFYQKLLSAVAETGAFSMNKPLADFTKKEMRFLMNGTGQSVYRLGKEEHKFEGVIDILKQKHLETNSDYIRKEIEQYMSETVCPLCNGKRLRRESLAVKINERDISDLSLSAMDELREFLADFGPKNLTEKELKIARPVLKEINQRLDGLEKVGLGYLSVDRPMNTLSGGEVTRLRLAGQLSTGLEGVIYVLDEPSIGLHPKDNGKLIETLKTLRDTGNSVIVVEHDEAMMKAADYLIDIGPGAGINGGEVMAAGTVNQIKNNKKSLTADYLFGRNEIKCKGDEKKKDSRQAIRIVGAKANNLKNVGAKIPLGKLVCVTGPSGSGKSTLVIDVLSKALSKHFYRAKDEPGEYKEIKGIEKIDKVIAVDQSPIGRTPRSNPATYTNVFTLIRDLFAGLPESKMYNYNAGRFSFNVKGGGRCEACGGEGYVRIPMQFLADVYVECPTCGGTRYSREVLDVHYRGKNISDVLNMTADEAYLFFAGNSAITEKISVLREVGLGYVRLGQSATTLSGGEAQRIKLATELSRASTGKTLYILDEPTTGLHFEDIKNLLRVLNKLVEKGNTVLIIEHNLDVIKCADYVIDMGPDGGKSGGEVVISGTPDEVKKCKQSWTGKFL